jgi:hypothetical protein
LAYLGAERHPAAPEVATAREQGIDVVHSNMQFWWAPRGTPADRVDALANLLEELMSLPEVRAKLGEMQIEPVFLRDGPLMDEIARREAAIAAVDVRADVELPNLALFVGVALGIVAVLFIIQARKRRREVRVEPRKALLSVAALGVGVGFVAALQTGLISFVVAASLVGLAWGLIFLRARRDLMMGLIVTAVVVSVACHFLFTRVLVIDLP